jgi:beta-alanine degradation protein BauB
MKKIGYASITLVLAAGAFFAGVSFGGPKKQPTFTAVGELTFKDLGGPQMADLWGNHEKGAYGGIMKLPAGFTSPMHTHKGDYQAIQIAGTSAHWLVGEDGKAAKKMAPGSYWTMPGKLPHVSSCEKGADCLVLVIQKGKFDFVQTGDDGKALPKVKAETKTETKTTTTTTPPATTTAPATTTTTTTKTTTPPATTTTPKKTP